MKRNDSDRNTLWLALLANLCLFWLGMINAITDSYLVIAGMAFSSFVGLAAGVFMVFGTTKADAYAMNRIPKHSNRTRIIGIASAIFGLVCVGVFFGVKQKSILSPGQFTIVDDYGQEIRFDGGIISPVSRISSGTEEVFTCDAIVQDQGRLMQVDFENYARMPAAKLLAFECEITSFQTLEEVSLPIGAALPRQNKRAIRPTKVLFDVGELTEGKTTGEIREGDASDLFSRNRLAPIELEFSSKQSGVYQVTITMVSDVAGFEQRTTLVNNFIVAVVTGEDGDKAASAERKGELLSLR